MASNFSANINSFVQKTKLRADLVLRKVALDGYHGLIDRSPVRTGRFRGNWRVGVEHPDLTTNEDKLPVGENAAIVDTLGNVKFGDTILLTNNLDYAGVLEHGKPGAKYADGRTAHSAQAPTGVLHNTFEDLKVKLEGALQRLDQA